MAIQANIELPNGDYFEKVYFKVHKITTTNVDYEYFEKSNEENIEEKLTWIVRNESEATIYVWVDEIARENRAQVIHWFNIKFEFNKFSDDNIFEQAYNKLKENMSIYKDV